MTQGIHGLVYIVCNANSGRYNFVGISSWSMTTIATAVQNNCGTVTMSGYIESNSFVVKQTLSSTISSAICYMYVIGIT